METLPHRHMNIPMSIRPKRVAVQLPITLYHIIMKKANTGTPANSLLRERRSPVFTFAGSIAFDVENDNTKFWQILLCFIHLI